MTAPQIVWLRRDLRLADQAAFHHAAARGPVLPVFVLDDVRPGDRRPGGAHRWWLHHSLAALADDLRARGVPLVLRQGDSVAQLLDISRASGAGGIHAIRHYEPWWRKAEGDLKDGLPAGVTLHLHDGNYLLPPGCLRTGGGGLYKVYSPFARAALAVLPPAEPLPAPALQSVADPPRGEHLDDLTLLPTRPDWAGGLRACWNGAVGEAAAVRALERFSARLAAYAEARNQPAADGSSRLSPHLHWGEISPARVWHALAEQGSAGWDKFRGELLWRDFTQNLIVQFPRYGEANIRRDFDRFPWRDPTADDEAAAGLAAWQQGRTGYPIVDAGMRQLWTIGWMHNRVRMLTASFLVKHLLIDWRHGERWFWDTLVDADYANNTHNWQWVAGTGVDAQQFTRIMAPLAQSEKFDAAQYIRRWVPELADLDDAAIHDPGDAVRPRTYPPRRVEHGEARERALAAYRRMKADA
ncbi:deoxyribodipyrimidine photo-lyase [Erythrobacteraceae bacterium CFH 75059]|uniref:cryptochrome/photolyase family protein n=1 Tax=Qipengyuania thermophila TaxID=2509361 RepID=UPI001020415D|nr:deoxyribodipyrimidine photo-lyase [Qipengyuania thermophila]TCD05340.1 deoxyribodipyrimidine photo-lyase [Erythrobacteraceae bacterium CFH 75059]